jgi:cation transport ATPase
MTRRLLAIAAFGAVVAGGLLQLVGLDAAGDALWAASVAVMLVPLTWSVARALVRGDVGVDAIALVSMAGALVLGQYAAGAVIALMLAGGNALEEVAGRRARRELTALVARVPSVAHRRRGDTVEEVSVEEILAGDVVVVRAGGVVPVDGRVVGDQAVVDESSLTGEALPATDARGGTVNSGTTNAGDAFELLAARPAAESVYAALVRLVREAESQRAPFVRLADRYAAVFLPLAAIVAGIAWVVSGDPSRALAVFVVATPCPLILAAPIALVSGVSRAARARVIVKGGVVIERLGQVRTALLDKTGTLTHGTPEVEHVPATIEIRRSRLLGLVVGVAAAAAAITWAVSTFAVDTTTTTSQQNVQTTEEVLSSLAPGSRSYVESVMALTPAQLRATFGTSPGVASSRAPTGAEVLGSLTPEARRWVEAISKLTPAQVKATFGTGRVDGTSPTRERVLASLSPSSRRYVESIMALTPAQLAATFGTER